MHALTPGALRLFLQLCQQPCLDRVLAQPPSPAECVSVCGDEIARCVEHTHNRRVCRHLAIQGCRLLGPLWCGLWTP